MAVQRVKLADICSGRERIFVDAKATVAVSELLP